MKLQPLPSSHSGSFISLVATTIALLLVCAASAQEYEATFNPANIAPTDATMPKPNVQVAGQPRNAVGHPCTLWDKEDVDRLKKMLGTNKTLQMELARLKAEMDKRICEPLEVPEPGSSASAGDGAGYRKHSANANTISDLGILYVLTGEAKYGEFCRQMLVAYAKGFPTYQHPAGWTQEGWAGERDGRITKQLLEDGLWLVHAAFGYDLVYNLPSWKPEERQLIRSNLFVGISDAINNPILRQRGRDYMAGKHNRSAIATSGILMAGYASDDDNLVKLALYGNGGTKEKPTGGVFGTHFTNECIMPDGLWLEGAPGYQLGIASCGLFNDAETLWHHGIDLYRFGGGMLKRLLDSAPALAYPNAQMELPALHDSNRLAILTDEAYFNNEAGYPYECGYRRYQDPRYLPIVRNATQKISMTLHAGAPSLFLDLPTEAKETTRPAESANFYSVGYGVLRLSSDKGTSQLILEYGRSDTGHSHPSKLGIDFYALDETLMPFPGMIFPYFSTPLNTKWYWTTLANCALTVDEKSQLFSKNWKKAGGSPIPTANQLVFGPASTMGMERAWSNTIQPGVSEDRSLFITPRYLADIFGAFSDTPHKYDLAWHFCGKLETSLKMEPVQLPQNADGYNELADSKHGATDQAWSARITTPRGHIVRFLACGGAPTEVIFGLGHFRIPTKVTGPDAAAKKVAGEAENTPGKKATENKQGETGDSESSEQQSTRTVKVDIKPPTLIERRANVNSVVYGNVTDVSGDPTGYVKGVTQEGGPQAGYGLLKIETASGTDLCFAAYHASTFKTEELETDAAQAFVIREGQQVRAMYLAGGKILKSVGGTIERSEPGLAFVEKTPAGSYLVGNPSPTEATVTVTLPALDGLKAFTVDSTGKRTSPAEVKGGASPNSFTVQLQAASKVEFSTNP